MGAYDQFSNKHKRKPRPQGAQTDNAVFAADKAGEDTLICTIRSLQYTANEGPVRIQYKCVVMIYEFPEMKLRSLVISDRNMMFCLPSSTFMYLRAINIFLGSVSLFKIGRPILGIYKLLTDT